MANHARIQTSAPVLSEVGGPEDDSTTVLATSDEEDLEESLAFKSLMEARKKRRRKRIIIGSVLGAVVLGVALMVILNSMQPAEEDAEVPEVTAFVYRDNFVDTVGATGSAQPLSAVVVSPEVDGIIETVEVVEGQTVNEGDVLFTLRNDTLTRAIDDAGSQVSTAQSTLDAAYREYNRACDSYNEARANSGTVEEWEKYLADWQELSRQAEVALEPVQEQYLGIVNAGDEPSDALTAEYMRLLNESMEAKQKVQEAQEGLSTAKAAAESISSAAAAVDSAAEGISSAKSSLATAQRAYDEAVANADKRTVKAPTSGSVLVMNAVVGMDLGSKSSSSSSSSTELIRIADFNKMRVAIEINEVDISRIAVGQQATVTFSALPDVTCNAVVESVSPVSSGGDSGGGGVVTYKVELVIDQPDPNIKPGMSATVVITTQRVDDTLIVPTTALSTDASGNTCVTVVTRDEQGEISGRLQVPVTVAAQSTSEAAISGQVSEGDEILIGAVALDAGEDGTSYGSGASLEGGEDVVYDSELSVEAE